MFFDKITSDFTTTVSFFQIPFSLRWDFFAANFGGPLLGLSQPLFFC